jgi:hypothetical protein
MSEASYFARDYDPSLYRTIYAKGDGDCAYHAVLEGLRRLEYADAPPNVRALRDALLPHATDAVVASRIRTQGAWAENEELALMAKVLGVCIAVWMKTEDKAQRRWIYFHHRDDALQLYGTTDCDVVVFLKNEFAVDNVGGPEQGVHYDTLVPISEKNVIVKRDPSWKEEADESDEEEADESDDDEEEESIDIEEALREETDDDDDDDDQDVVRLEDVLARTDDEEAVDEGEDFDDLNAMKPRDQFEKIRKLISEFEHADTFQSKDAYQRQLLRMRNPIHEDRLYDHPAYLTKVSAPLSESNDFELTANQRFLKKYMSPETANRAILLFHGVGVGKTCSAIQIAENYRNYYEKRCLVILPGGLEDNFRRELFDPARVDYEKRIYRGCSGQRYLNIISEWHRYSPTQLQKRVRALISKEYEFGGFMQIVNTIEKLIRGATRRCPKGGSVENEVRRSIREYFSNRLVVIDEVHNIRLSGSDEGAKLFPKRLRLILQDAVGVRLVLLSATPMFNSAKELQWIMEVVRAIEHAPHKTKVAFDDNGWPTEETAKSVSHFARNYVSYLKGEDPDSFPTRLYPLESAPLMDLKRTRVVAHTMGEKQTEVYENHREKNRRALLPIGNVVFETQEGLAFGRRGFFEVFEETNSGGQRAFAYRDGATPLDEAHLPSLSAKLADVVQAALVCNGPMIVYSFYLYAGVAPLAIALEHAGFRRRGRPLLVDGGGAVAPSAKESRGEYVVLTADDVLSPNNTDDLRAFNAEGSNVKIALISQVGSEGLSFRGVREMHVLEPWFNMNRIEQVIGRAVRFKSHAHLAPEERNVTVYLHASVSNASDTSADVDYYEMSERKTQQIEQLERLMARNAIDCPLNTGMNNQELEPTRTQLDSRGKVRKGQDALGHRKPRHGCSKRQPPGETRRVSARSKIMLVDVVLIAKRIARMIEEQERVAVRVSDMRASKQFRNDSGLLQPALKWLVFSEHRIRLRSQQYGRLIGTDDPGTYLVQPTHIHDPKLTVWERSAPPRAHIDAIDMEDRSDPVAPPSASSAPSSAEVIANVHELVHVRRRAIEDDLGKVLPSINMDARALTDMVIDRFNSEELRSAVRSDKHEAPIAASVAELVGETPQYYFDHHLGGFRDRVTGEPCPIIKNAALMKARAAVAEEKEPRGMLDAKNGEFKIVRLDAARRNKRVGTVCSKTSSIKNSDLLNTIRELLPASNALPTQASGMSKRALCMAYEYMLRTRREFARP